ncbi:hypothetical protein BOS5A_10586 [Bosea sp. EC-HK365B]|nr:hypothetical protein BOSE21B_10487 [Bosea sp. 21B]CAD5266153.1 hypothetical protein BOSE7B_150647 [Bosea sp. 7B]VVT44778.1 hypothetical protein BOS5A_10586 [Bosea sp. EC-HK365B]VXC50091.1 hypothetical protein BOSE127_190275 [Bosea sp. 127]
MRQIRTILTHSRISARHRQLQAETLADEALAERIAIGASQADAGRDLAPDLDAVATEHRDRRLHDHGGLRPTELEGCERLAAILAQPDPGSVLNGESRHGGEQGYGECDEAHRLVSCRKQARDRGRRAAVSPLVSTCCHCRKRPRPRRCVGAGGRRSAAFCPRPQDRRFGSRCEDEYPFIGWCILSRGGKDSPASGNAALPVAALDRRGFASGLLEEGVGCRARGRLLLARFLQPLDLRFQNRDPLAEFGDRELRQILPDLMGPLRHGAIIVEKSSHHSLALHPRSAGA